MCVIIQLLKDKTIPADHLYNAAANNWHSWGIIVRDDDGKLEVHKGVPEGGTHTDLDRIKQLLNDNLDKERIIHFRHNTRGHTSEENTHPFLVFEKKSKPNPRKTWFMHNGTFLNYGRDLTSPKSDTLEFVEQFLTPALSSWNNNGDRGNYQDEMLKMLIDAGFLKAGGSNRGILVADGLEPYRLGTWVKFGLMGQVIYHDDHVAYYASNDDYFKEVKRGPVKEAKDKAAEEARIKADQERQKDSTSHSTGSNSGRVVKPLDVKMFQQNEAIFNGLSAYMGDFCDITSDDDLARLSYVTLDEFEKFLEDMFEKNNIRTVAKFVEHLCVRFQLLMNDRDNLVANQRKVG